MALRLSSLVDSLFRYCVTVSLLLGTSIAHAGDGLQSSLLRGYPEVLGEYLQIPGAEIYGTPAALNTVTFLRLRSVIDGEHPKPAHAVLIAIPDMGTSAAYWLPLSAQLIRGAPTRQCSDHHVSSECRIEVWILLPRSSNLIDSRGVRLSRAERTPMTAIDYYFGRQVLRLDPQRQGKWPIASQQQLIHDSKWQPFMQIDVPFMAEWGFEAQASDLDRLIARVGHSLGGKNIFLAGLGAGGDFALTYAARQSSNGKRGFESLAGLILLDSDVSAPLQAPTPTQANAYLDRVNKLRRGQQPVFTEEDNSALLPSGPIAGATQAVAQAYYALAPANGESIFSIPSIGRSPLSPKGDEFLASIRLTHLAHAGMSMDVDPLPTLAPIQAKPISTQGASIGRLDFEFAVDRHSCASATQPCLPVLTVADRRKVIHWQDTGTQPNETRSSSLPVGKAQLWLDALGFSPARSNINEVSVAFRHSGKKTIDASALTAGEWYASERYASDVRFLRQFKSVHIHQRDVHIDLDRNVIVNLPVYSVGSDASSVPQLISPLITDYTQINRVGTYQTDGARAIQVIDPSINSRYYHHADYTSADDSVTTAKPGEPGASLVSNTLLEWMLRRSEQAARVPSPNELGVRTLY